MARTRQLWNKTQKQTVYAAYYRKNISVVVKKMYSSFPSTNTLGYPERILMHPLTAERYTENISYERHYINGLLASLSAPPEQYLDGFESDLEREHFVQTAINRAIEEFMENKQQLAADFAERQKTIDMVTTRLIQAIRILRDLKRFKLLSAYHHAAGRGPKQKLSKKAAKVWLEYQYGWRPLVGSIHDIVAKDFPPLPERYIKKSKTISFDRRLDTMYTYGYARATCAFIAQMTHPVDATATKLGLTNPASIAWEVVPFSFVIDWFIPVSTWLKSLDTFYGYRITEKSITLTQVLVQSNVYGNSSRNKVLRTINRQTQFDLSYRPYVKSPLSIVHAANALALLRSLKDK